jgi:FkbM family methyltransferase
MPRALTRTWKAISKTCKTICRTAAAPLLPLLPDALANRFPFLGKVAVRGPGNVRVRFFTYGPAGKDRIALKLCRQGILGYEPETVGVFLALLHETRLLIDVGANTGMYALLAAALDPARQIVAFAPNPQVFDMLQANIRLNRYRNIRAESLATSDQNGEVLFYVTETGGGIPTDSSSVPGFRRNVKEVRVPAVALDHYLTTKNLGKVDVLKIDAEAAEPKVLAGANETIKRDRPLIICEVLECVPAHDLHRVLDPLEYQYFHLSTSGPVYKARFTGNPGRGERNYLLVGKERVREVLDRCKSG